MWIKDTFNEDTIIINADQIIDKYLINSSITILDNKFEIKKNIVAQKINIENKNWILEKAIVTEINNFSEKYEKIQFESNFDFERINNLFSDLSSLTYFNY